MPHVIERASSGRAKCRGCEGKIAAGDLRFGERLPNPFAEGENVEMTHWFHLTCAAFRRPEAFLEGLAASSEAIDNRAELEREAQLGVAHRRVPRVSTAERAPTGRTTCRACKTLIEKDAWRIALAFYEEGRFVASGFMHATCVAAYLETTAVLPRIAHFSPGLGRADLDAIQQDIDHPGP